MEQTSTPHAPDQQAGAGDKEPTRPQPPVDTAGASADATAPPVDDTGFEPV